MTSGHVHGIDQWEWLLKQLLRDLIWGYLGNENTLEILEAWCSCCTGVKLLILSAFNCALLSFLTILSIVEDLFFSNFICVKHYHGQKDITNLLEPLLLLYTLAAFIYILSFLILANRVKPCSISIYLAFNQDNNMNTNLHLILDSRYTLY